MSRWRIAVALGTFPDAVVEEQAAGDQAEVVGLALADDVDLAARQLDGFDALVVTNNPVRRELLVAVSDQLAVVVRAGIGLDSIDLLAARERGISVCNTPGYATDEVATHAMALMLAAARRVTRADICARNGWIWADIPDALPLHQLTLGLLGAGRIGRRVAEMAQPIFESVIAYDPAPPSPGEEFERVDSIADVFTRSAVVSLHLPLTFETRHIVNAENLGLMPRGSVLVNVSRGGLVDEAALLWALDEGFLSAAALDVLDPEPPAAANPILDDLRVILSPHSAWASSSSSDRVRRQGTLTALEVLGGTELTFGGVVVLGGNRDLGR